MVNIYEVAAVLARAREAFSLERRKSAAAMSPVRRVVLIHGIVHAVGFRYTVDRIARNFDVAGTVRNVEQHVEIDVEGEAAAVGAFLEAVYAGPPPHARIDRVESQDREPLGRIGFRQIR